MRLPLLPITNQMSAFVPYFVLLVLFYLLEIFYFRIAGKFNIIDKPNHRSSHTTVTIRGGGILFPVSVLIWFIQSGFAFPFFVAGLLLISLISFVDDINPLKSGLRTIFQIIAVELLLLELPLQIDWYWYPLLFVLIVGTKNAYNFMDGINGITGSYSLITLSSLWYINRYVTEFTTESLIITAALALLVFNYFNFRKKAKCFAGDVGSVSMAFIILFLLMQLLIQTGNYIYIMLLLVYGLDTVSTIFFRLIRRENILEAHRSHFYQFLANERKWPHLRVSVIYSLVQLAVNILILFFALDAPLYFYNLPLLIVSGIFTGGLFVFLRFRMEGSERLISAS